MKKPKIYFQFILSFSLICSALVSTISNELYETSYEGNLDYSNQGIWINLLRFINLFIVFLIVLLKIVCDSKKVSNTQKDQAKPSTKDRIVSKKSLMLIPFFILASPPFFDYLIEGRMLNGFYRYSLDGIFMIISWFKCLYIFIIFLKTRTFMKEEVEI